MGTWTRVVRATSVAHSSESAAAGAMRVLTRCMSAAAICDRAAKAAQTAAVASQVAAATSASRIATGKNRIAAGRSTTEALAVIEAAVMHLVSMRMAAAAALSPEWATEVWPHDAGPRAHLSPAMIEQ